MKRKKIYVDPLVIYFETIFPSSSKRKNLAAYADHRVGSLRSRERIDPFRIMSEKLPEHDSLTFIAPYKLS